MSLTRTQDIEPDELQVLQMSDRDPPNPTPRGPFDVVLSFFHLRRTELSSALLAVLMFFCLLCGYSFIRPVREAFGIERGMDQLYYLFIATLIASLLLSPVFSWIVGKCDRRIFLPLSYGAIVLMLLGFAIYRELIGTEAAKVWMGRVFYVWLSVINLFMIGLFWSLMADCFGPRDARRLFPFIAVGGTLGALFGAAAAWAVSGFPFELFGQNLFDLGITLTPSKMMVVSAGFITCAGIISVILSVVRPTVSQEERQPRRSTASEAMDGMRLAIRSPYILGIGGYICLLAIAATLLYFTQNQIVLEITSKESTRVGIFASIDFWTQLATLVFQFTLTARLVRWIGIGWSLALLPAVILAGYIVLAYGESAGWGPAAMLTTITVVYAAFRAAKYAIGRPVRETLFTVVSRDEKYKAKSLIDTFVYRTGDTVGAGVYAGLAAITVATMTAVAVTVAPIAIVMGGLALYLGSAQNQRATLLSSTENTTRT